MSFPIHRPRRLRRSEIFRSLVREREINPAGFVYPMFVCPGANFQHEVGSMPGVYQKSPDRILEECREIEQLGISGVILFGLPDHKDRAAWSRSRPMV